MNTIQQDFFFILKNDFFFGKLEKNSVKKNLHKDLALALHGLDIKVIIIIICNLDSKTKSNIKRFFLV